MRTAPPASAGWALVRVRRSREPRAASKVITVGLSEAVAPAAAPAGSADDVALLLARTQGPPAAQGATRDTPADPALVAPIREQAVEQPSGTAPTPSGCR